MSDATKVIATRLVEEVINGGRLELVEELFTDEMAPQARAWIAPFRRSFPDVRMTIVELVAEGPTVVGRFTCSATHLGDWQGRAPTGRRFEDVDEVYFLHLEDGRIASMWGLEDSASRMRQLGMVAT